MNNQKTEKGAQSANKVGYRFTAIPTHLMCMCDSNIRSALFVLIQLSSEFADADGWFFRSNEDLQIDMRLSQHLVVATVDALYRKGIVSVKPQSKKKKGVKTPPNYYRVNFDKFKEYESIDFNSLRNPDLIIKTMKYKEKGYKPQYLIDADKSEVLSYSQPAEKVPTNIDNIETKDTISIYEHIADSPNAFEVGIPSSKDLSMAKSQEAEVKDNLPIEEYSDRDNETIEANTVQTLSEYKQRGQQFNERNAAISDLFKRIEEYIRLFKTSKSREYADHNASQIKKALQWGYEHKDYFTQRQWNMFIAKETAFNKLSEHKTAYFQRGRKGKNKPQSQTKCIIMECPKPIENINHTPPTPILEEDSNSEIITTEELMTAFDNLGEGKDASRHTYYSLNETNLRTEDMSDKEREYFRAEEERLSDDGVLNRYIFAHRWLRNPKDADRLFETYQERASQIANGDCALFETYINRWNTHCEQAA